MRYITSTLLITFFLCSFLNAQDCPPGNVSIESQAQADAFAAQYPNCTEISGSFYFSGGVDINITGRFSNLERITDNLGVSSARVEGVFESLDTIMGSIVVSDGVADGNSNFARLDATFQVLKYIGGGMWAGASEGAASLGASFPVLERIEGGIHPCYAAGISCGDCVNLEYIGGDITGPAGGLNHVDTIMGTIDYVLCGAAATVSSPTSGFDELKYLGGSLIIGRSQFESIGDITGFQQLNTIVGSLYLDNHFDYYGGDYEITGLGQLKHAGSISIDYYNLIHNSANVT